MSIITAIIGTIQGGGSTPPPPSPSYDAFWSGSLNEGSSATLSVQVNNFPGGRVWWTIEAYGSPAANFSTDIDSNSGQLSGFYDFGNVTSNTQSVSTIYWKADTLTEGAEYFHVKLGSTEGGSEYGTFGPWVINDTSTTPAGSVVSASWSHGSGNLNEGQTTNCTVTTANFPNGTTLYWWDITGSVSAADFSHNVGDNILSGTVSGLFTIVDNAGVFALSPRADFFTDGAESMQIAIGPNSDHTGAIHYQTLAINDSSTLGATMIPFVTSTVPTTTISGIDWPAGDGNGNSPNGIIYNNWSRDSSLAYGGVTSSGNTYIEFPTRVTRTDFTIEMVANFTNVGGWQSIWDSGSMNEGGVGYTCYTSGGPQLTISTNYGTGSAGTVTFTLGADYEGLAQWIFVIDFTSGENCKVYRNGVALTKVSSTAVAPLDYGLRPLMISARRGASFNATDFARGTIYFINAQPSTYSTQVVADTLASRRNTYGMTLSAPPTSGYGGNLAVFGTNQYSTSGGNDIVQIGWKVIAVGGTQAGWFATISETNAIAAGGLRVGSDTWPQDATSYILSPF